MDRREFFSWVRGGLAGAAAASLMLRDGTLRAGVPGEASPRLPALRPEGEAGHPHLPLRGDEPRRLVRPQARPDRRARPVAQVGRAGPTSSSARSAGSASPTGSSASGARAGLWVSDLFPHLGEVADELTVIRSMVADTVEPHPGHVPGEQRLPAQRLPRAGRLAELRPGERVRRPARLRRDPRRPRVPRRRGDQLVQRLPPRPPSGGGRSAPGASRSTTSSPPGRSRPGPSRPRASSLAAMNRRHLDGHAAARTPSPPGSGATSWPRGCRRRSRWSPTSTGEPAETLRALRPRPPRDRRLRPGLPDRPPAAGAGRPVRPAPLRRDVRQPPAELGRPRGHEGQPRPGGPADRPARRRPAPRPPPPGDARRHARPVHHRVRPDPVHPVGRRRRRPGPRPQPVRLQRLDGRRRASSTGSPTARPTRSAGRPPRTPSPGPTSTPPSCTCSGSTTSG